MPKLMIVPPDDYEVLKRYLGTGQCGVVLLPQQVLETFPKEAQDKFQAMDKQDIPTYDFGGEPDVNVDFIMDQGSYVYAALIGEEEGDED